MKADFRAAWTASLHGEDDGLRLLPTRLTIAAAQVLPVADAGLSVLHDDLRVPIGASSTTATVAERLQFTHGEGPCLDGARSARMVVVDADEMRARWPEFADDLFRQTPYRGVISVPIRFGADLHGAMDLYAESEQQLQRPSVSDVAVVSEQVRQIVSLTLTSTGPGDGDLLVADSLESTLPAARRRVWIAIGMLMQTLSQTGPNCLALLRAYAYAHGSDVDDVAAGLVTRTIALDEFV